MMKKTCFCLFILAASAAVLPRAASAKSVEEILKGLDINFTSIKDAIYDAEMVAYRDQSEVKRIKFSIQVKGLVMKRLKFTYPGDINGMMMLTTAQGNVYVFLPSYNRVRRVATHVRNQGFMGTDISPDDMNSSTYSGLWDVKIVSEDAENWILDAVPRKGVETSYSKQRLTVRKDIIAATKIDYFDANGVHVKTQLRDKFDSFGPGYMPKLYTFKNLKTGTWTVMRFLNCRVNTGIPDSAFTKRAILRAD